jgi:hypothetical protein
MKTMNAFFLLLAAIGAAGCSKDPVVQPPASTSSIAVPNGDFENWNNQLPAGWQTNSCPPCVPAYETYIVQQDTGAYQGQFAAKFMYNNVYAAWAENGFAISAHPQQLEAHVKCHLAANDSVGIHVKLFHNNAQVDDGHWYGTASINGYTQVIVPVTQNSALADSAVITIEGGHVNAWPLPNTELWVDEVSLQ